MSQNEWRRRAAWTRPASRPSCFASPRLWSPRWIPWALPPRMSMDHQGSLGFIHHQWDHWDLTTRDYLWLDLDHWDQNCIHLCFFFRRIQAEQSVGMNMDHLLDHLLEIWFNGSLVSTILEINGKLWKWIKWSYPCITTTSFSLGYIIAGMKCGSWWYFTNNHEGRSCKWALPLQIDHVTLKSYMHSGKLA